MTDHPSRLSLYYNRSYKTNMLVQPKLSSEFKEPQGREHVALKRLVMEI